MGAHRGLRPHELARKDQCLAAALDAALSGGTAVIVDEAPAGMRCSWCNCPPEEDPRHARPGYACPYPCRAGAVYLAVVLTGPALAAGRRPRPTPLCGHHRADFDRRIEQAAAQAGGGIDYTEPWADDDYVPGRDDGGCVR